MYVDASALTAIVKDEPERRHFVHRIEASGKSITSAVSVFEAAMAFSTMTGSCASALREIEAFLDRSGVEIVPIERASLIEMAIARDRYGKGSGHPARLNLGDCISYGVAKAIGVPLLYKGEDFALTDLA